MNTESADSMGTDLPVPLTVQQVIKRREAIGRLWLEHRDAKRRVDRAGARLRECAHDYQLLADELQCEQFKSAASRLIYTTGGELFTDLPALSAVLEEHRAAKELMDRRADELAAIV